jgi:hypothetical protein
MDKAADGAPSRYDATSAAPRNTTGGARRSMPAWNREQLIVQFQRIDGSTRIEAERQVADFEESFRSEIGGAGTLQRSVK